MNLLLADLHKFVGYSGGIEHVLSRMAFAMKEKGYHVSVVMADEKEGASFYPFPKTAIFQSFPYGRHEAHPHEFFRGRVSGNHPPFQQGRRQEADLRMLCGAGRQLERVLALEKPDVIISFREPHGPSPAGGAGHEGAGDFHAS